MKRIIVVAVLAAIAIVVGGCAYAALARPGVTAITPITR